MNKSDHEKLALMMNRRDSSSYNELINKSNQKIFHVYKDKKTGKYLAVDSEDSSDDFFYTDSIFLTDDFEKAYKAKNLTSNKVDKLLTYRSGVCTIGREIWNEFGDDPSDKFYPDDLDIVIETYLIQLINVI